MNPELEETITCDFITSAPTTGAATDADSTPTCEVFEDVTDTSILSPTITKRSGKTGNYRVPIACTTANGFEPGKSYNVIISATVGGVAAKAVLSTFQIRTNGPDDLAASILTRATSAQVQTELGTYGALKPTVAGRTLDVAAGGEAGLDFDNTVGTLAKGTEITGFNDIAAGAAMTLTPAERTAIGVAVRDTDNTSPAASSVGADIKSGISGDPWSQILPGAYPANSAGSLIGNNLDAKVSTRLPTASYTAPPTASQNATATRDIDNTNPAANSLGAAINRAASAGDPWSTLIPGSYGAGTAGKILGDNIDAKISSRMDGATYVAAPSAATIAVAVRDVSNASPAVGSLGADVKSGGTDPWTVLLPGSYAPGSAGFFIGDRLDNKVSTRMASTDFIPPVPAASIAVAVRDVNNSSPASGSMGEAINSAASAGDPWGTLIPGTYNDGTAGQILGTFVDEHISSRMPTSAFVTPPTKEVIAIAVRDVNNASPAAGSMGEAINRAASAGDPWSTQLPGSYVAGSAGKLMSDNLDAKVSSRLAASGYTTPPATFDIANAVRDVDNRTPAPNSLGAAVNAAASAGDPWSIILPGAYGANTAGNIIGNRVDATVSSRLAANNYAPPYSLLATAQAVRDVDNTNPASGSLGEAVNRAASAGDPWNTQLPGAYGTGTAGKLISDTLNATVASRMPLSSYVVPPNVQQIAAATRDVDNTNPVPGSLGDKVNSAASAGDPWATVLPGTYGIGTAGNLIGNNMDTKVSSRMAAVDYVVAPSAQVIAQSVRDIDNTAPAANSLGAAINVSAVAGDPWIKVLPGSYAAGSAGKLIGDNIDAKISSRSTYAGTDTPGTTTLLTRVPSTINSTGGKVDVNDKTGFSLTPAYDAAKTAAQPGDAMSLTPTERTTLTSSIWQYLTGLMTTAGTIGRLIVDNLNATVSSRLAASAYVPADNAGIASIKSKTDNLPADPASVSSIPSPAVTAAAVRDVSNATPAAGSLGADVKAGAVVSDPWAINIPGSYGIGTAGNVLGNNLDVKVSTRLPTSAITLNNGQVTVATNNDKTGYSLASGSGDIDS